MKINHVVIATDLSENSGIAAQWASSIATLIGAQVTVLHVIETGFLTWLKSEMDIFENEEALASAHENVVEWFSEHSDRGPDHVVVRPGSPLPQLERIVDELGPETLIVLARSSKGGFERFFLGSTVQQVVARPPAAVAVVHPDHIAITKSHAIVTGTDFSENAHLAVQFAADLGHDIGAPLHILHANAIPESNAALAVDGVAMDIKERIQQLAEERMKTFVLDDIDLHGVPCEADVIFDCEAADAIVGAAEEDNADIVVVGHNGSSALVQNILGSVTQQVLRNTPSTIIIVPSEKDDEEE